MPEFVSDRVTEDDAKSRIILDREFMKKNIDQGSKDIRPARTRRREAHRIGRGPTLGRLFSDHDRKVTFRHGREWVFGTVCVDPLQVDAGLV